MISEDRLAQLENEICRANRRVSRLIAGLTLCIAIAVTAWILKPQMLLAQTSPNAAKDIRANRFVLEDESGKTRAELFLEKDRVKLVMVDGKGKTRVALGADDEGAHLTLCDKKGTDSATLLSLNGDPSLHFLDGHGETRILLALRRDGPSVILADDKGKTRVGLASGKVGPSMVLCDEKGTCRAALGYVETKTQDGAVNTMPESSLLLFGADGKVRWNAP